MARTLQPEEFEALLGRLGPDREAAGERYVELRRRLITIFEYRHCAKPEDLADDTLDRVARKLLEIGPEFDGNDPWPYAYAVAWRVAKESFRRPLESSLEGRQEVPDRPASESGEWREREASCLERCLRRLPKDDRELVLSYHEESRRAKIQKRKALAHRLGATPNALRLKVHRITCRLRECVFRCMELAERAGSGTTPPVARFSEE